MFCSRSYTRDGVLSTRSTHATTATTAVSSANLRVGSGSQAAAASFGHARPPVEAATDEPRVTMAAASARPPRFIVGEAEATRDDARCGAARSGGEERAPGAYAQATPTSAAKAKRRIGR